ncbi:MAG TPA: hypothetical protein VFU31_00505 [Candidatus Binatia bacterium]|nr:hypothetical protein [Candidatus Binatia bacterium]
MKHARPDYDRIQDPALTDSSLLKEGSTPIAADEPVFLLRAQDRTAAEVVRYWAQCQQQLSDHDANAVKLAREHAHRMEQWPKHKTADV